jgi:hypothetical protein
MSCIKVLFASRAGLETFAAGGAAVRHEIAMRHALRRGSGIDLITSGRTIRVS